MRQKISLQQGIPTEKAKEIVRLVKDSKKKAQASIQGDTVRVSSKDRDELQAIIALLRGQRDGRWICSSPTTARINWVILHSPIGFNGTQNSLTREHERI